jgi:hypothetical protein
MIREDEEVIKVGFGRDDRGEVIEDVKQRVPFCVAIMLMKVSLNHVFQCANRMSFAKV